MRDEKIMEASEPKGLPEGYEDAIQRWKEFDQTHQKQVNRKKMKKIRSLYERLRETDGKHIRMGGLREEDDWFCIRLQGREFFSMSLDPALCVLIGMSSTCHIRRAGRNIIIDIYFQTWELVEK